MPVIDVNVKEPPKAQTNGTLRGVLEFVFSDGRKKDKFITASTRDEWDNKILDERPIVEAALRQEDARGVVDAAKEILAFGEAAVEDVAVAYLRQAMSMETAYEAFLLFDKFNDFRNKKGWSLGQVQNNLMEAGLTEEEWGQIRQIYSYLSSAGRPDTMRSALSIQEKWEDR